MRPQNREDALRLARKMINRARNLGIKDRFGERLYTLDIYYHLCRKYNLNPAYIGQ